ncbi:hypothetical protein, partial [Burkholderia anthina]|uniref:hypothetical protein n=1 Tax=Burkholderia anthina TaxID=179879 RepID=UPI001ABB8B74
TLLKNKAWRLASTEPYRGRKRRLRHPSPRTTTVVPTARACRFLAQSAAQTAFAAPTTTAVVMVDSPFHQTRNASLARDAFTRNPFDD